MSKWQGDIKFALLDVGGTMGAADRTEKVLREIHILFSKAEPFEGSKKKVIVDKNEMLDCLKELNECMYDMMEEHELTVASRDKATRQMQRANDEQIFEARKQAEDIYAASIMYSDRSLTEIQDIIRDAQNRVDSLHDELMERLKAELQQVKTNQYELKGQLEGLIDTQKYLRLIEDVNAERQKEKRKAADLPEEPSPFADIKPEIKINEAYFMAQGLELPGEEKEETAPVEQISDEEIAQISANLDAEYFGWKEEAEKELHE